MMYDGYYHHLVHFRIGSLFLLLRLGDLHVVGGGASQMSELLMGTSSVSWVREAVCLFVRGGEDGDDASIITFRGEEDGCVDGLVEVWEDVME
jgi:hypothetical protein